MSESDDPAGAPQRAAHPVDGDVVVVVDAAAVPKHAIRQLPAEAQFGTAVKEEAVRVARGFAAVHQVDLWLLERGEYSLLERFRRSGTRTGAADTRARSAASRRTRSPWRTRGI